QTPPYDPPAVPADATDTNIADKFGYRNEQQNSGPQFDMAGIAALDAARFTVTGPTNKTVNVSTATGGQFNASITDLAAGTYTVTVEGLINSEVSYFGTVGN